MGGLKMDLMCGFGFTIMQGVLVVSGNNGSSGAGATAKETSRVSITLAVLTIIRGSSNLQGHCLRCPCCF